MPEPRCRCPRRSGRSLRRRLAFAFVGVSFITLMVAFAAMRGAWFGGGWYGGGPPGWPHPWNFHVAFIALAVAAGVGIFTAGRITGRLTRLRDAVERFDLKDLSLRVPVEGADEVATLALAFNRMADRLEAEERTRRQLFADVAHELRHPLAVLRGRLELMQDGVIPLDAEQVLYLQDMVIALTRLVADLRDLSLAEVGRLSLNLAPLDLKGLIADLQENMEPVAAEKGIRLTADVPSHLPLVNADADRIRQVLVNLLANALHYTPEDGRVAVRAWAEADRVLVQVRDDGPGIAPEDLAHVFDRFYRTDRARSRVGAARPGGVGGSGLGLAIVQSLINLHGGAVRAESRLGEGSRFTVTLPAAGAGGGAGR